MRFNWPPAGSGIAAGSVLMQSEFGAVAFLFCQKAGTQTKDATGDKEHAEKLNRKKAIFRQVTGTKKALFTTLITTY